MYKKIILFCAVALTLAGPVVRAEEASPLLLTDEHIALIRTNCVSVQSTMQRIHASDGLLRINLGQRYETIATRFMAPMNSRIALNRLDNVAMTQTTAEFNDTIREFSTNYQQYEQTMSKALEMKCTDQPVAFYDTVTLARSHRASVHDSVTRLGELLGQYGEQFAAFKAQQLSASEAAK